MLIHFPFCSKLCFTGHKILHHFRESENLISRQANSTQPSFSIQQPKHTHWHQFSTGTDMVKSPNVKCCHDNWAYQTTLIFIMMLKKKENHFTQTHRHARIITSKLSNLWRHYSLVKTRTFKNYSQLCLSHADCMSYNMPLNVENHVIHPMLKSI